MVLRKDYTKDAVNAARSVLLEIAHLLGEYRDDMVVVGGWVPELILPAEGVEHIGSIDVDVALNHRRLTEVGYKSIAELLLSRGYQEGKQPFIFHREVQTNDHIITVEVDFLAGEYEGTSRKHRTQKVQDMRPRKARGVDLAFEMPLKVAICGTLPGGGEDMAEINVASVAPFLVMKGMALKSRLKEKDAWDIYYCVRHYPGGIEQLGQEFLPILFHGLVQEGLHNIAEKFSSPSAVGPTYVADFEELTNSPERALLQRDAYERVNQLLRNLGVD
jgi:hypothetical protein